MSEPRLYGNWLRPQQLSIRGVGWKGALLSIAGYLIGLVVTQYRPRIGVAIVAGCLLLTAASATTIGGTSISGWATGKLRWVLARRRGGTAFRALTPTGWVLPRPLDRTRMLHVHTAGRAYGAVHDPATRRIAVTLRVASTAADLTDPAEHDASVGRWERWLEGLGRRPEVAWVDVTVETAPSPGAQLREMVAARLATSAPTDCRELMTSLLAASPAAAALTDTRVTITFDLRAWDTRIGRRARRDGVTGYLPLLDRCLDGLESALGGCGVTVIGRATAADLAAAVRAAFDPAASGPLEVALDGGLVPGWELAGPAAAQEWREAYQHDGALSATFVWAQAPRQLVTSTVLDPIARPMEHRKRFTCTYVATPAGDAMNAATAQVRWRWFAQTLSRLPVIGRPSTAQEDRDAAAAEQATREVAAGAGWVAQTLTVTVTGTGEADLAAAVAELEHAAGASQLRLRRLYEQQAAGFLASLPAGFSLAELATRWTR